MNKSILDDIAETKADEAAAKAVTAEQQQAFSKELIEAFKKAFPQHEQKQDKVKTITLEFDEFIAMYNTAKTYHILLNYIEDNARKVPYGDGYTFDDQEKLVSLIKYLDYSSYADIASAADFKENVSRETL